MANRYIRLTKGLNDKGILIKPEEVQKHITSDKDYYTSLFYYNDEHLKRFKEKGTIKGIRDNYTDQLWFDFDDKDNPELARKDAVEVYNRLIAAGVKENNIEVYFSGNKGFNVIVTLNRTLSPEQVHSLAINKYGKGLQTLDNTMYDSVQILRVPYTKHPKSGLYKIPLSKDQLFNKSLDDIKALAKSLDTAPDAPDTEIANLSEKFYEVERSDSKVEQPISRINEPLDFSKKPPQWKNCKWSILQGNFKIGERHHALMVLAATLRGMGYDETIARHMCLASDEKHCSSTGDAPVSDLDSNIIPSIFDKSWEGGQYTCEKPGWLQTYCKGLKENSCKHDEEKKKPITISQIAQGFKNYVKNIDKNTIKTGIRKLDEKLPITIGMNLGIVGSAGSGKTSVALEILKNTSKAGVTTVMASLDMHRNRLYEKLLYKVSGGKSRQEIYELFNYDQEREIMKRVEEDYGNVWFYDRSSPTVQDIRNYVLQVEQETGKKVKLVMIDYFERVTSDVSEDTAASKKIAGELQDMLNDLDVAIVTLVQPNKFSITGGPDSPILSYTAIKGSSFLYQSFRSIISIWRPFYLPVMKDHDKFLEMAILKNDLGELDHFIFGWTGKTGDIKELESWELEEYDRLIEMKKAETKDEDEEWK